MTIRDEVIAVLEEAFEELEEIRDFKLGSYAMNPDFPDPDKAREFGLTVEEMTGIDDIMLDVDAVYSKLGSFLEKMTESDK